MFRSIDNLSLCFSITYKDQGWYEFQYDIKHDDGGNSRKETRTRDGRVEGQYAYFDRDGNQRILAYVADADGFRASVASNEQGVSAQQAPASVNVASPEGVAFAKND